MDSIVKGFNIFWVILGFQLFELAREINGYEAPPNCLVFDCPLYDVLYSIPEFEIRRYRDANWISFPVESHSYKAATIVGYSRVLDYATHAQNRAGVNISLTWPVLVDVGFATNRSTTTTYFYLPQENQADPPVPLLDSAKIIRLPLYQYAAVRRYHRYSNEKNINRNVLALKNALRTTAWKNVSDTLPFSAATYHGPDDAVLVSEVLIWFGAF